MCVEKLMIILNRIRTVIYHIFAWDIAIGKIIKKRKFKQKLV
jgi:hypothetical protein